MAFPSPLLFPSDSLFPTAFAAPPPPPPSVGGLEQLTLDDIELNDGRPWTVMKDPAIEWTPPKKKLNWIGSPLSDGSALAGSEDHYENAEVVLTVGMATQTSKDTALQVLNTLTQKLQEARRTPGGLPLTWTPSGSSSSLTYYVIEAEYEEFDIHRDEGWFTNAPTFRIHLYLRPFGYGSEQQLPLGYSDQFIFDSLKGGPWRIDSSANELDIATPGTLTATAHTTSQRIYIPYSTENVQVAMRVQINAGYGFGGLRMKRTGGFTHLFVGVDDDANKLQIRKYETGTATVLAATDFTPTHGNFYWVVGTITDNTVFAGIYDDGTIDVGNPTVSVTYDLTGGDVTAFGTGVRGQTGIHLVPSSNAGVVVDQFRVSGMSDVTSAEPVGCLDLAGIRGDVDAEARQAITEASAQARNHYEWGLESQQYDPTLTWPYVLDSDSLVTSGFNGSQSVRGGNIFDPNTNSNNTAITSGGLSSTTPVTVCGTGSQRHVGAYKVKARVANSDSGNTLRLRISWRTGEGSYTNNDYTDDIVGDSYREVDLGTINIVQTGLTNQTWNGLVQAYSTSGTSHLVIDYLMLIPLESWGAARNPVRPVVPDTFTAFDHFGSSTGWAGAPAMSAKPADVGGNWANLVGSGMTSSQGIGVRYNQDAAIAQGNKLAVGSSSFGPIQVQADTNANMTSAEATGNYRAGVLVRYVDSSNWAAAVLTNVQIPGGGGGGQPLHQAIRLQVFKSVAATVTSLGTKDFSDNPGVLKTVLLNIDAGGYWQAYVYNAGAKQPSRPILQGQDAVFATGSTLASGRIGLYDAYIGTNVLAGRSYDNFVAYAPPLDAVLFASRHLQVRSDRTIRESSTGGSFGKVPRYFGDRFFLPPAGANHNTCRLAWKARRSDVDGGVPDTSAPGTDATTLSVSYTPRYLLPTGGS